jgi:trehalose 6-phosphate phosphatase
MSTQQFLQSVLSTQPCGILLDIDGTLSPIAPRPEEARLYPGIKELLEEAKTKAVVGIMTGRAIDDGANIVQVDDITYIGNHGLEWSKGLPGSHPIRIVPEALQYVKAGNYLLDLAEQQLVPKLPGIVIQRKSVGGSIHYRLSPEPEQARNTILSVLEKPAAEHGMVLREGKLVVEIQTPLKINKGQGLRRFIKEFGLHGVIFAGDDQTDLDALREIEQLRRQGIHALGIAVQHHDSPKEVLEHADLIVSEVKGMAELLQEIVQLLEQE